MTSSSKKVAIPNWFKLKRYPHIGLPISPKEVASLVKYVKNKSKIAAHAFMPLVRREVVTHPYKRNTAGERKKETKVRDLTYANHIDSMVFAYYAELLQKKYEIFVNDHQLGDIAVAYRKIKAQNTPGNKCNIHIAGDVFGYVRNQLKGGNEVSLITFDIKGFFDNLDHKILKNNWKQIMGHSELPTDEYNVFKHSTQYSYIKEDKLFYLFKDQIICQNKTGIVEKKIKRIDFFKSRNVIAFCYKSGIKTIRESGYINGCKGKKGIPQGLPISAILANIYMCNFDVEAAKEVREAGGIYKRYSDDIVVVCPLKVAQRLKDYIISHITSVNLNIETHKTNLYELHNVLGKTLCFHETQGLKRKIEYLGFSFDGERVLIKSSGISKYYYKVFRAKRRHKMWAISINNSTNGFVFEHPMFKHYSLAGSKRHIIRRKKAGIFVKTKRKTYGNYLTYVYKASEVLNEPAIKKQLRRNLNKLKKSIAEIYNDVDRVLEARNNYQNGVTH